MPVAPIDVDPDVYLAAGALFLQVNAAVCDVVSAAATAAGEGGAMAGTDGGGADWAAGYDEAAATALRSGAALVAGLGRLGELLGRSGTNHADAESSSTAGGPPAYPGGGPAASSAVSVLPAMPPSANGTDDDPPPGWSVIASLLTCAWPTGHQDRLRAVGAGWNDAAAGLTEAADRLTRAIADVGALQSPEVAAAVATCTQVQQATRTLSDAFATLGAACSDYAGYLDDAHAQVIAELVAFAAQAVGNAIVAAQAGGAGGAIAAQVPRAAQVAQTAARVDRILAEFVGLVSRAAGTVRAVHARMHQVDTQLQAVLTKGGLDSVTRAVAAVPAVAPYDLRADEAPDRGHTIDRHVGKSDEYLKRRQNKSQYASTFLDLRTAERATAQNIAAHQTEIGSWLAGGAATPLRLRLPVPGIAGRIWSKKTGTFVPPGSVVTVLVPTPTGYFVLSSFPGR